MASVPVAVVNETMARTYWTNPASVIGGRIRLGSAAARPWATVVGILADQRHAGVTAMIREKFFISTSSGRLRPMAAIRSPACSWWPARPAIR
jgi:hypothetical protein